MDRQIITFEANEQTLIKTGGLDNYSSNKVSYIEAHFALGQNWAGYDSVRAVWSTRYECISTVLDTEGICVVPYEVLKWKDKVMVNLVGSISENNVLTDRITTYPVKALEVDADAKVCGSNTQPITPSEYEQFVEAVKADADRAEEAKGEARVYAGNALSSAQNALISETNASASEDNAKASELNAETYKNQAQTYAQNAHNSAISAENAKDEAVDARDTILGMRAEATTLPEGSSATASYNDGVMSFGIPKGDTGARGATGETGATPQLSIGTVTTTTEPSVTITGTAENPVLNFGLVKGDKGDTGEVSLADLSTLLPTDTASGSIASFPDGQSVIPALSVLCDIEPIQDLHGYDKPWSGGAGINKWDEEWEVGTIDPTSGQNATSSSYSRTKNYIKVSPNTNYYLKNVPTPLYLRKYGANKEYLGYVQQNGNSVWAIPADTYYIRFVWSGTTYNNDIAINYPSTVTTYSPYSNICPISGHDEVNVSVCGVNVWDEEWEFGGISSSNGAEYSASNAIRAKNYIEVIPSTKYYFACPVPVTRCWYDENHNHISTGYSVNAEITAPANAKYFRFGLPSSYGTTYKNDIALNYPSTATSYEPYQGTTYEVSFGTAGTVYGGTVDVVSGVLTVDLMYDQMTYAYLSGLSSSSIGYQANVSQVGGNAVAVRNWNWSIAEPRKAGGIEAYCNAFPISMHNTDIFASQNRTYFGIGSMTTVAEFLQAVQTLEQNGSGLFIAFKLATPQTYQLTPTEVQTLLGQNNVWNDCGDTEVTYKADVTKWVEKHLS